MQSRTINYILLMLIFGMVGFFGAYSAEQYFLLRNFSVQYAGLKLSQFDFKDATSKLFLKVTNRSAIEVEITGYDLIVTANNKQLTKIKNRSSVFIAAFSTTIVPVEFETNLREALGTLFSGDILAGIFLDYSKVNIRIAGKISLSHRGIAIKDYPIDITENLATIIGTQSPQA